MRLLIEMRRFYQTDDTNVTVSDEQWGHNKFANKPEAITTYYAHFNQEWIGKLPSLSIIMVSNAAPNYKWVWAKQRKRVVMWK